MSSLKSEFEKKEKEYYELRADIKRLGTVSSKMHKELQVARKIIREEARVSAMTKEQVENMKAKHELCSRARNLVLDIPIETAEEMFDIVFGKNTALLHSIDIEGFNRDALTMLTDIEAIVLYTYLTDSMPKQIDIAKKIGLSASRVGQILTSIKKKMRHPKVARRLFGVYRND